MSVELGRTLLDLLCPRRCAGCGRPVGTEAWHLCWDCLSAIATIQPPFCSICGDPISGAVTQSYACSLCVDRRPAFDRARSAARYQGGLKEVLQQFKYNGATHLSRDLGLFLGACVRQQFPDLRADAIAFVPLAPRKERERTYNQSRLLARELGRRLALPVWQRCLRRTRDTATQTHLTAREREANVRGAFAALNPDWLAGRTLILVDDVMTTGATVKECARVLKDAGVHRVVVATVARG